MFLNKGENTIHVLKYMKDAVFLPYELFPLAAASFVKEGLIAVP